MKVRIQVIIEDDDGHVLDIHDVFSFQRKHFQPEQVGLTLAEAKGTLHGIQETVVHHQVDDYLQEQRSCPACGQQRKRKGKHTLVYRTLFGSFQLPSPRFYRCHCQIRGRAVSVRWRKCSRSVPLLNCCIWRRSGRR